MCHPDRGDLAKLPMLLLPGYPTRDVCCSGGDARNHVWAEPVLSGSKTVQGLTASSAQPHACAARHRAPGSSLPSACGSRSLPLVRRLLSVPPREKFCWP